MTCPFRFSIPALTLVAGMAVSGCECDKNSPPPPQFQLAFSPDTLGAGLGFRRAEVRSAYLIRYRTPDYQQPADTLRQPTAASAAGTAPVLEIHYSPQHPPQFAVNAYVAQNVTARSFRLVVPAARRSYDITNIVLVQIAGNGRCSAPRTTHNEATVNGQLRDALDQLPELTK